MTALYSKFNLKIVLINLAVGLLIGLYFFTAENGMHSAFYKYLLISVANTVLIWGGCMTVVKYLWRKFPWEQNPLKHLLFEILLISLLLFITGFIISIIANYLFATETLACNTNIFAIHDITFTFLITFLITAIHEAAFFYRQWKLNFSKSVKLEKQNLEARFDTLKAQVNPHFLFNSLNSLMNLVEGNKDAEKYIQNLSDYLRYVLTNSEVKLIALQREIENIDHYIALQKIRFGENLSCNIKIDNSCNHKLTPPLSIQILVENAIKHNTITKQSPLKIDIYNAADTIIVENNLQVKTIFDSTGKGLENLKQRIAFFTSQLVEIEHNETIFRVKIPLIEIEP